MSSPRRLLSAIMVGIVVATGFGILRLWQRERDLRADEAQVLAELSTNRRLGATLQAHRSADAGQPARGDRAAPSGAMGSAKTAALAGAPPPATNLDRGRQIRNALLHMPEYAPFLRAELRRRTMRNYGEWLMELNVSPERLEVVKQLLADKIGTLQDAFDAATSAGYRMGTREFSNVMNRYVTDGEARLQKGLTAEEYTSYRSFEAAKSWTTIELPDLEDYFGERGVPTLSPKQKLALREAYVAAQKWKPSEGTPAPGLLYRMQNERIGIVAGPALEPAQREALVGYLGFVNTRSRLLGQLYYPNAPDALVVVPGRSPR